MAEKAVYALTDAGEKEFEKLMLEISGKPIRIFLDFNAVVVNLMSLPPEKQNICLTDMEAQIKVLKSYLEENIQMKENLSEIPNMGKAVLHQQYLLVQAIEEWMDFLKEEVL